LGCERHNFTRKALFLSTNFGEGIASGEQFHLSVGHLAKDFLAVVADDDDELRAGLGVIPDYLSKRLSGAF
jgi:hypothetical protein